eukprot:scaffold114561_cov66-Phaeocystis_antarctica.AAC.5
MSQASAACPACELETHGALEHREEVDRERVGEGHAEEQHDGDRVHRPVGPLALAALCLVGVGVRTRVRVGRKPSDAKEKTYESAKELATWLGVGLGSGLGVSVRIRIRVRGSERARYRAAEGGGVCDVVG